MKTLRHSNSDLKFIAAVAALIIALCIGQCLTAQAQEGQTASEIELLNSDFEYDSTFVWAVYSPFDAVHEPIYARPFFLIGNIGVAEIRKSRNGEFYLTHKALNGKKLMHSENVKSKAHLINLMARYYPDFAINDLTHLKPVRK